MAGEPHTRIHYQCSPYHTNSALHPVIVQIERAARFATTDDVTAKHDKLEALLALSGCMEQQTAALIASLLSVPTDGRYPALDLSPPQRKERTLAALVDLLAGLARRQPVLVVFEDAHWIDPTSLELLDRTVALLQDMPVLNLILYRPEFRAPWTGSAHVTLVALNRLSRADRAAMAVSVAGGMGLPQEALDQLAKRTDGVPLFVEELTKSLLESGELETADNRYVLSGPMPTLAVPDTLQDALMARLDRLVPVKAILQAGACIGREFSFELLVKIGNVSTQELSSALEQLAEAGSGHRPGRSAARDLHVQARAGSGRRVRQPSARQAKPNPRADRPGAGRSFPERHQARDHRPPFDRGGTVRAGHSLLARSGTTGCQPVRQPEIDYATSRKGSH